MTSTNWAGNIAYRAGNIAAPRTIEDLQDAVRAAGRVRALGTTHCFNDIADTDGRHISLENMRRVVEIDGDRRQVVIEGGARYGDLGPILDDQSWALHNLASLPHISVAGACATATHGSGPANGNLAVAVKALDLVTAAGDIVTLSRESDPERFPGAVVNLGRLGVVARLTLDTLPAFQVRQTVYENLPWRSAATRFREIMACGYSVSLFTDWHGDAISQMWVKQSATANPMPAEPELFGAHLAEAKRHPLPDHGAINCTEQGGVAGPWYERLPHFRMAFTPSSGDELQAEYFVAAENAVDAMAAIRDMAPLLRPALMISEIRTIAADDLWLSPNFQRASVALHFTFRHNWPAVRETLPHIERALAPYDPRPHWGKLFTMPPESVRTAYPGLSRFAGLVAELDPEGKFANAFCDRYLASA